MRRTFEFELEELEKKLKRKHLLIDLTSFDDRWFELIELKKIKDQLTVYLKYKFKQGQL